MEAIMKKVTKLKLDELEKDNISNIIVGICIDISDTATNHLGYSPEDKNKLIEKMENVFIGKQSTVKCLYSYIEDIVNTDKQKEDR
jgi:hypothetical protein